MSLIHFLLAFDHEQQKLVVQRCFDDVDEALEAYAQLESEHRGDRKLEIVLVGADSLDTIKQTHGNYFDGAEPLPELVTA